MSTSPLPEQAASDHISAPEVLGQVAPVPADVGGSPDLAEIAERSDSSQDVPLPSGRNVHIAVVGGTESLRVTGCDGAVELTIKLSDNGHKLIFDAADIELNATEDVRLSCRNFQVEASERASVQGADMRLEATRGDVQVHANDHVSLVGEQIRLNCDKPDEIPEWMAAELGAKLASAVAAPEAPDAKALVPQRVLGDASLLKQLDATDKQQSNEPSSER